MELTAGASPRNVLILCDFISRRIGTVRDHLTAFKTYSANNVCIADTRTAARVSLELDQFELIVLHYSIIISSSDYLPRNLADKIREFAGCKILFIQDEYRWVDRTVAAILDLGIHQIYSVVNKEVIDKIYHHPSIRHVRRKSVLTGYVPEELTRQPVPAYSNRSIDVGYRARKLPAYLGRGAQEKWSIGERFKRDARQFGLICDIEHKEEKRYYGDAWIRFLSNCKAVLGTESCASFVDFSGEVQTAIEAFEAANPNADFDETHSRFLEGRDNNIVIQVISPRCFEAAALRTLMILYPGSYSGILEPWRHYVPLKRDHSNMDEVVAVVRNPIKAQKIIDAAYHEVALDPRYSYRAMVEEFDRDILENLPEPIIRTELTRVDQMTELRRRPASVLQKIEQRIERTYRRRLIIRWLILSVIRTFLPKRVRSAIRVTGERLLLIKSGDLRR
jgi:hypothetical protein